MLEASCAGRRKVHPTDEGGSSSAIAPHRQHVVVVSYHPQDVIVIVAVVAQGGGGGNPGFATAGGKNAAGLPEAISLAGASVQEALGA